MSKYTTELRYICESLAGYDESQGFDEVDKILRKSAPLVFSFNYPIFDSAYKLPLEMKILRHFYTREISEETYGLWKLRLQAKMNEIMPYYNQLYRTETLDFNPLYDVDYKREYTKNSNGEHANTEAESATNSENTSGSLSQTDRGTGTVTDAKTGTETRLNTGTVTDAKTGTEALAGSGTVTDAKTGTETTNNSGTDTLKKTGTQTSNETGTIGDSGTTSNTETRNATDATTIAKDTWDLYSDTPQGGINGLLDNGVVESGTDLANNAFLTNARHIMESGNAGTVTKTGTIGNSGTNSNTRTLNTQDQTTYNVEDKRTLNTQEQTTFNTQNQQTRNTTDTTTFNTQDLKTLNTSDALTLNTQNQRTLDTTDTLTQSRTGNLAGQRARNLSDTGTISNVDEYTERVYGKTGGYTYSKALMEYRKALLNIDKMVINELNDLFFGLW